MVLAQAGAIPTGLLPVIRCTRHDAVLSIGLDRPARRNALATPHWRELADTLAAISPNDTRVVVLRSRVPGIFSAGADLGDLARLRDDVGARPAFLDAMRAAIDALAALPVPTVAVIDGGCHGAAVALVLACDLRIAGPGARFAVPPARLGLLYPVEDVTRLAAQVGAGHAARLLFAGDAIDAVEAQRIGLVEQVADDASASAAHFAMTVAANDPDAVRGLKAMLAHPADPGHRAAFLARFGSDAFAAGLAAFAAREGRG